MKWPAAPYAVAGSALAVCLLTDGPAALRLEAHWLQRLQALGFALAGVFLAQVPSLPAWLRVALPVGGAWLAVDERLMVHECFKFTTHITGPGDDAGVLLYGVLGAIAVLWLLARLRGALRSWLHLTLVAAGLLATVSTDVFGALRHWPSVQSVVEEGGELLAAAACIALGLELPLVRRRLLTAAAVAALAGGALALLVQSARPWLCPPRLRGAHHALGVPGRRAA